MIGKMVSVGFGLATLPARMTYRGTRALLAMPGDFEQVMREIREASDDVAREIQALMADVDMEMSRKAEHLSGEQKQQAAELALDAAEKHLSMAAVNMLRALWLAVDSNRSLEHDKASVIIEHE
jgi:uncharacterized protein (DUF2225 family)